MVHIIIKLNFKDERIITSKRAEVSSGEFFELCKKEEKPAPAII
jgi:hypothetical protein